MEMVASLLIQDSMVPEGRGVKKITGGLYVISVEGNLESFILDLGDATKISAVISHNFNAVELVGLREMMLHKQYDKIDQYEQEWRKKHNIKDGEPSTLIKDKIS